jgi:hypothetical protein
MSETRKLAATLASPRILAVGVVGYSRLMDEDEVSIGNPHGL